MLPLWFGGSQPFPYQNPLLDRNTLGTPPASHTDKECSWGPLEQRRHLLFALTGLLFLIPDVKHGHVCRAATIQPAGETGFLNQFSCVLVWTWLSSGDSNQPLSVALSVPPGLPPSSGDHNTVP